MMIHNDDERLHQPPTGWDYASHEPEVMVEYDAEAWFLVAL